MKSVIYETSGRAREYNELAINLFTGCGHGCQYCYAPFMLYMDRERFHDNPRTRVTPADIQKSAWEWREKHPEDNRAVLLCFTCDPYQPIEEDTRLTRTAIEILHAHHFYVSILTKGGRRAMRDFDMLLPGDSFAVTLTTLSTEDAEDWEPGAAPPYDRIYSLVEAHKRKINTWVSIEPVLFPEEAKLIVKTTKDVVGQFRIGMLNYHKHADTINWKSFGWDIKNFLDGIGVKYYIKKDLWTEMGIKDAGGSTGPKESTYGKTRIR